MIRNWYQSKRDLLDLLEQYRDRVAILTHEVHQLRRGLEHLNRQLDLTEQHIGNTEHFLAVLQAEQLPDTTT